MKGTTILPQGYKKTPVGIIPEDWDVKRLGDLSLNGGEYGINAPAVPFCDDLPTYLRITDIDQYGNFSKANMASVDDENSYKFQMKDGDIVFARTGATVGKTYLYNRKDENLVFAGFLIRFSLNVNKVLPYLIKAYTNTNQYWHWVKVISQRSGQPGINSVEYASLQIPTPPLSEQQKIAEILSLWDKAIEKQSQLISHLERRKKGLMQQLLTGKKRLPGFEEKWETKKLQEICELKSNYAISREQTNYIKGEVSTIHYGDVLIKYPNILDTNKECIPYINDEISKNTAFKSFIEEGDIIMADTAEDETVGRACEVINLNNRKMTAGLHTFFIHPKIKFAKAFLGYYINSDYYHKQIIPLIQGIKVSSITRKGLLNTRIDIPSFEEQEEIAEILLNADSEINYAKQYLFHLHSQKRGLMQQLLTGKIRVIQYGKEN